MVGIPELAVVSFEKVSADSLTIQEVEGVRTKETLIWLGENLE